VVGGLDFHVVWENLSYFFLGRYPKGPVGGVALTLYLAVVSLALSFLGGLILPGVDLMRFVLHEHTGRLPLQEGRFVRAPRNTIDAIETGCRHAQAGAVERMFRIAGTGAQCLVSGGAGNALIEQLDIPCRYVENLVLEGLARIALS